MSPAVFHIEQVQVNRMPGFRDGVRISASLSPQLNLITGPNASGKSSLARAIQKAIWQETSRDYSVTVNARSGRDFRKMVLGPGFAEATINGQKTSEPLTSTAKSRYLLALHELVQADEAELAAEIHRQLNGGYDLESAANSAGFSDHISTKAIGEYKALHTARKQVFERTRKQEEIKEQQQKLKLLKSELNQNQALLRKEKLYQLALAYRKAVDEKERSELRLSQFPQAMKQLTPHDLEEVENCENEITEAEKAIHQSESELKKLEEELQQIGLPPTGIPDEVLERLAAIVAELEEINSRKRDQENELIRAESKLKNAAKNLQLSQTEIDWPGLNISEIQPVEEAWSNTFERYAASIRLRDEIDALSKQMEQFSEDIPDRDELVQGIRLLTRWLQEQQGNPKQTSDAKWPIFALAALAVVGTFLAVIISTFLLVLPVLAIAGIVLFLALQKNEAQAETGIAETYRSDFEQCGVMAPESWEVEHVSAHIAVLSNQIQQTSEKKNLNKLLDQKNKELIAVEADLERFFEKMNDVRSRFGINPERSDDKNPGSLYWLLANGCRWQEARDARDANQAGITQLEAEMEKALAAFNQLLNELNLKSETDLTGARSVTNHLRRAEGERRSAMSRKNNAIQIQREKKESCNKLNQKMEGIYSRLEIQQRDKQQLRVLHHQLEDYRKAFSESQLANQKLEEAEQACFNHPLYAEERTSLEVLNWEELEQKIAAFEEINQACGRLQAQIGGIEAVVQQYREGHDLEAALKQRDDAFAGLESAFEQNLLNYSGHVLTNVLQEVNQQQNDSVLYKKADEIFRTITRQRFSILAPVGSHRVFRAYDEVKKQDLNLNELSTGTRIQLLLAVRLAYIETQEKNFRLPLFADELLANSDDVRAQAIIDALIEISKTGRQVFYITAQADEVNKWKERLDNHPDLSFEVISLEGAEGKAIEWELRDNGMRENPISVPAPENDNHRQYGERVGVPHFNLMQHPIENLHLWYLIDDVNVLYDFLRHHIRFWGQLRSLEKNPPLFAPDNWQVFHEEIQRNVKLIQAFQKLYRTGRPKPIDRGVLLDSGAVSGTFIAPVDELLIEVNGDPQQLLDKLRQKAIAGFRSNKIDELEAFLLDNQLLANGQEMVPEQQILDQLYSIAAGLHLAPERVNILLQRLIPEHQNG